MRDDAGFPRGADKNFYFNPRPSHEGRRAGRTGRWYACPISIHVPRMRDDRLGGLTVGLGDYFNPRPSHEGRPSNKIYPNGESAFQSTSLA